MAMNARDLYGNGHAIRYLLHHNKQLVEKKLPTSISCIRQSEKLRRDMPAATAISWNTRRLSDCTKSINTNACMASFACVIGNAKIAGQLAHCADFCPWKNSEHIPWITL